MKSLCAVCELQNTNPSLFQAITQARLAPGAGNGIDGAVALAHEAGYTGISKWKMQAHFGVRKGQTPCPGAPMSGANQSPANRSSRGAAAATSPAAASVPVAPIAAATLSGVLNADGTGSITTPEMPEQQAPSWDDLIVRIGGDPHTTKVKNDTIRVSSREVRIVDPDTGEVSYEIRRSYSAALEPRNHDHEKAQEMVRGAVERIRSGLSGGVKPVAPSKVKAKNKKASFFIAWGDTQLGKSAGGGHETTVDRFVDCIARAVNSYEERVSLGYRYDEVFMSVLGDITEGTAGNYDSQLFTVTLNKTDQDTLAVEVVAWAIEFVRARTGLPLRVLFVNSNHGEHSRLSMNGGARNKTSSSDTVDRMVANMMKMVYRDDKDVEILSPGGNLVMTATLSGVPVAFAHGHGIGPRAKSTTIQQELVIYDEEIRANNGGVPFLPRMWVTAHYHHAQLTDLGPYLHVQTPALDGGSEWFMNVSGKHSRPGLFIASVGSEFVEDGGVCRPEFVWVAKTPSTKRTNWHEKLVETYNQLHSGYGE